MKVVSWNLGFWQHRSKHNEAWEYLREEIKPDLALLQEVIINEIQPDEKIILNKIHGNWGTALCTKKLSLETVEFDSNYPNRVALGSTKSPKGFEVIAASIHAPIVNNRVFPHLDKIFDELKEVLNCRTFIVGGDLNSARLCEKVWPGYGHGPFFKKLSESIFFDCFRKFHEKEEQTFFRKGCKRPFQDDHLFVSKNLADKVESCYVLNNEITKSLSDHIPIICEIDI